MKYSGVENYSPHIFHEMTKKFRCTDILGTGGNLQESMTQQKDVTYQSTSMQALVIKN